MKCLSLWQPWAWLIATGRKHIETRSWTTTHRGPLAIHAAQRPIDAVGIQLLHELGGDSYARFMTGTQRYGVIVAMCELLEILPIEDAAERWPAQRTLGDFSAGRWAWRLVDVQALQAPMLWRGRQQLFDVPDDLIATA